MPKAILSVHDKTGLAEFARGLRDLGWTLIASGGTAKLLHDQQITVIEVAAYTGSPEILGGRVKTLHPAIHGGLLARATDADRAELRNLGWDYIDLVAVNLYPFEQTIAKPNVTDDEAIENIDPGPLEAIMATGATRLQAIAYGILPQIIPPFVSYSIYQWDINVRMATIVGFAGGGGIGWLLYNEYFPFMQYRSAGTAVALIVIVVTIMDFASA